MENQKESVVGRKALADKTKGSCFRDPLACALLRLQPDFKKIPDEDKLTAFKGLLKGAPLFRACLYHD